jgi:hypothetical protein
MVDGGGRGSRTTRRAFLHGLAAGAAAGALGSRAWAEKRPDPIVRLGGGGREDDGLSRVARVVCERVMPVRVVHRPLLRDCLHEALKALSGQSTPEDAWHAFLQPDDLILIKFNQSAAYRLGTTPPLALELLGSLTASGWDPRRIVVLESGQDGRGAIRRTRRADLRWQGREVEFGQCGKDSFVAALDEATAIINAPFLKTHHLATMTSCLKNLSHGLIRRPARFHSNGCDPAIGEIAAHPEIRNKLRINVVNALRVVYDDRPDLNGSGIHPASTLLVGVDPVACDAVGFGLLNEIRSLRGLGPLLSVAAIPRQLTTADRLGVGRADIERIRENRIDV